MSLSRRRAPQSSGAACFAWGALALLGPALGACRDSSGGGAAFGAIAPSAEGSNGCAGESQLFTPGQLPALVPLASLVLDPSSALCAAQGSELLYATGAGGTIYELDFGGGSPPLETELVAAGEIDTLLATAGVAGTAELVAIAVLDATTLLVAERTGNWILAVDRSAPASVQPYAGLPLADGGFADGLASLARFDFAAGAALCPSGDERVFVADAGNHALRVIGEGVVGTLAGNGAPGFADGSLANARFDTPSSLLVGCTGVIYAAESGAASFGGHRVRALALGPITFGGQTGTVTTVLGDGVEASVEGIGPLASLAAPAALAASAQGELYWIDASTGVVRRQALSAGVADCPLFADCASAVGAPTFTPGGRHALALTSAGVLYALDADAAQLWRITP